MGRTFPWETLFVNQPIFPGNLSCYDRPIEWPAMGKGPKLPRRQPFVGAWIDVIPGATRKGAAAAARLAGESYISNLDSGEKQNPSALIMLAISEYLGITVNDLYRPPPTALKELANWPSHVRDAIIRGRSGKT